MITRNFKLFLNAGKQIPLMINVSQYDHGEKWVFTLYDDHGQKYTPSTGAIVGIKADNKGIINTGTVNSAGQVEIMETQQMTAAAGKAVFELVIDDGTHGTANFIVLVEPKPGDNADLSETDISMIEQAIEAASSIKPYGSPLVASTVADMTDHEKVYVYVGSETGYTSGNWYYWDGTAWTSGGVYNSVAVQTDTTLTLSGVAADAKKTGDEISDLKSEIAQMDAVPIPVKYALDTLLQNAMYKNDDNTALKSIIHAWATEVSVVSISAVYVQGSDIVYDTDPLSVLRENLTVTASYNDGTSGAVLEYTLDGELTTGTSIITVAYGGKSDTISVTVTHNPIPVGYTEVSYITATHPNGSSGSPTQYIDLGITAIAGDAYKIETSIKWDANQFSATSSYPVMFISGALVIGIKNNVYMGLSTSTLTSLAYSTTTFDEFSASVNSALGVDITVNGTTESFTRSGAIAERKAYLFCSANASSVLQTACKASMKRTKIYHNDVLIRDLYPVVRNSDTVAGFYDVVNDVFYHSAGASELSYTA